MRSGPLALVGAPAATAALAVRSAPRRASLVAAPARLQLPLLAVLALSPAVALPGGCRLPLRGALLALALAIGDRLLRALRR
jgi:hypothetical protein